MQEETVMRGYRLSPQQRQVWLAQQHDAGAQEAVGYVAQCLVRIEGRVREEVLREAVAAVVERHEILRTRFQRPEGMKTPVQVIDDEATVLWRVENLSGFNTNEQGRRIAEALAEESVAPFDDKEGAVVRLALLTLSEREQVLIFTLPSICADSWSLRNLAQEVSEAYGACERGEELSEQPLQYADLCEWQNELLEEDDAEEGRRFWREQILDAPETLTLPLQLKPVAASAGEQARGERVVRSVAVEIDTATTRRLSTLAAQLGVSHDTMMQACWESLLWRLSGQHNLLVATLLDGRHYEELASALGLFARYVPLSVALSGGLRLRDLCAQIEERNRTAQEWQDYFNSEEAEGAARMPLVGYAYHQWQVSQPTENLESEESGVASDGLRWRVEQAYSRVQSFALQLVVIRRGESEVSAELDYDAAYYEESAAQRVAGYYAEMLRSVARGGMEQRVSELELMGAPERARVLAEMSGEREEWESAKGIVERFEEVARESGERVALEYEGEALTYAELNARANQLAHCLRRQGVRPETKVGLLVERSLEMLVGLLGILKAGGAYVPLNVEYPKERLGEQLADTQSPVVLTQESLLERLPQFAGRVICLDRERSIWESESESDPQPVTQPEHLAYVIYTSGSTGRPKGVAVTHGNLANYTAFICRKLKLWEPSAEPGGLSFATVSTLAADLGNTSIFPSLVSGGRLHVISYGVATDSERFASYMSRHSIDVLKIVPSHLRALMASQERAAVLPRRFLILGGEALSYSLVGRIRESSGVCRIINHYGPTETTVGTLVYSLDEHADASGLSATVPIGRPIANTQAYILDEDRKLVPAGLPGELYIGGRGVARGYLNRPEQTAERFIPNPFSAEADGARLYRTGDLVRRLPDGQIEFLGRVDHQVKIRGFRIELGEIEVLLGQHASVREAVVVAREDEHGHKRLIAYVVAAQKQQLKVAELQSYLKEKLPDYMIPTSFVVLDSMPLNANGKLERTALPSPEHAASHAERAYAAAGNAVEKQLAEIWKQVLGLKEVGVHDNFFELGGDSIISIQIIARAHQAGLRLAPKMLFQHQTISELAAVATLDAPIQAEQGSVSGVVPLTPIQRWFFEQDIPARHHWNQSLLLEVREALRPELLARAVQELAVHHDALRLRFRQTETGWQQFNEEAEQATLFSRADLSMLSEAEQTRAVEEQCAATQASLNLSEGPLLRVVQFDLGAQQPGRLLIVIHHLTVDGLSWRILLEDLLDAYRQLERGATLQFPAKTTPFKKWAEQLSAYAQSDKLREEELDYWMGELGAQFEPLPVDVPGGDNTVASTHVVTAELDAQETRALLQEVPAAYRTHINDALLAALANAFGNWSGAQSLLVELEGHGREELFEDADVSRTVGWFTTHFPVALNLAETREPGRGLKFVKEQLRRVPHRGIGYGLLRYMREDDRISARLRNAPQPQVSFNYLGQLDQTLPETSPLALAAESAGAMRSDEARRSYLLEIVGSIVGGQLRLSLTYSRHVHRQQRIEALAGLYVAALRSLIAHCQSAEAGGYTPSDFPLIKLEQEKLDQLLAAAPPVEDIYPLSPVQQGLLFHSLYEPEAGLYFEQKSCILRGKLNVEAFQRACQRVVDRHPILRTAFMWQGLDEPLQVVQRQVDVPWTLADWRGLTVNEQAARLRSFFSEDRARHFEPAVAPLMRMALLRLEEDAYHFIWSHHHLLLDGWTMPLLFKEVFAFYEAFRRGSDLQIPLPPPYRNYIAWLKQQDLSAAESFWRTTLGGINAPTSLASAAHTHDSEPVQGDIYSELEMHLPETASQQLRALARQHQLTLSTVLQGVWSLVLSHHTGSPDVIFGAPVSGRPASLGGVEFMVGLFINTLPVRVRVAVNEPALAWLKALQEQQVEMRQYEYSPLVQVQQWSDVPRELPLFESILVFDNYPIDNSLISADALDAAGQEETFEVEDFRAFEKTNYALLIQSGMAAQLAFRILYDRRLFEATAITRILKHVELLLTGLVAQPDATLDTLLETLNVHDREQQALAQQKRQESRLKRFAKVAPKAIDLGEVKLVETSQLSPDQPLPLVCQPTSPDLDPLAWARARRPFIQQQLATHGGLLFRRFPLPSTSHFEQFASALCPSLFGDYGDLPRASSSGKVYGSTPYPPDQAILFHNESSHLERWPMKIFFYCVQPARRGGTTPITDCRKVWRLLAPEVRERLRREGLIYVRNYAPGLDVSWQDFFRTTERGEVEARLRAAGVEWEWTGGGEGLRVRQRSQAAARHPQTGEEVFFNQIQLHHVSSLAGEVRRSLEEVFGEEELPRNVYYGSGERIEEEVMAEVGRAYEAAAVDFEWERGDVVMLDNMLVAHGRRAYEGERKIVVAMGEMVESKDIETRW
jgi:amino acid adenylation domain-containing protein/non-ribosomal peptide synthase protein (TIGR01720 family)